MQTRLGPAILTLVLLSLGYIGVLAYLDIKDRIFEGIAGIISATIFVATLSFVAFMLRSWRWAWLLRHRGYLIPRLAGHLAYLAGFALTALPGKLGELVRIRYFSMLGVPPAEVIGCFFFERVIDILAVLLLASFIAEAIPSFRVALFFVGLVLALVVILCRFSSVWRKLAIPLRHIGWRRGARVARTVGKGLSAATAYVRPTRTAFSLLISLIAFGLQSLGFVHLVSTLGISIKSEVAIAVFPLATLVGAASMIPGGIGTTEAATVLILRQLGAPFETSLLAAIGMRLGTLWFAIAIGLAAAIMLELEAARRYGITRTRAPKRSIPS